MCYYFGHTVSNMQVESNNVDKLVHIWVYLFLFCCTDMSS
jgi:hypothetical protein